MSKHENTPTDLVDSREYARALRRFHSLVLAGLPSLDLETLEGWNQNPAAIKKQLQVFHPWKSNVFGLFLKCVCTVSVRSRPGFFFAKNHFTETARGDAALKLAYISESFKNDFLAFEVPPEPQVEYAVYELNKRLVAKRILKVLGGETKAEISIASFCTLLEAQGRGEPGVLFTDGLHNLAFVRNAKGSLCNIEAVYGADGNGWSLRNHANGPESGWPAGSRIVSLS